MKLSQLLHPQNVSHLTHECKWRPRESMIILIGDVSVIMLYTQSLPVFSLLRSPSNYVNKH
jgi:hypothetical protein